MVKEIRYSPIFYSKLKRASFRGLMEALIDCTGKGNRKGNVFSLQIKTAYLLKEYGGTKEFPIFKSTANCEIVTDGSLTPSELYQPYRFSMDNLIATLQILEKEKGLPVTTFLRPISFGKIEDKLKTMIDQFLLNP